MEDTSMSGSWLVSLDHPSCFNKYDGVRHPYSLSCWSSSMWSTQSIVTRSPLSINSEKLYKHGAQFLLLPPCGNFASAQGIMNSQERALRSYEVYFKNEGSANKNNCNRNRPQYLHAVYACKWFFLCLLRSCLFLVH